MDGAILLDNLELGSVERFENIAVVPVFRDGGVRECRMTLDQALEKVGFTVTDHGPQYHVAIENGLENDVFIAGGTTLEGASQNRAAVYPGMVAAGSKVEQFPVHCVEQGCNTGSGSTFTKSSAILIASARSGTAPQSNDQRTTWTQIGDTIMSLGSRTGTSDYVSADRQTDLGAYLQFFGEP